MSGSSWIGWLALSAAVAGLSVWHYRRRETPGRGRTLLALLRGAALALVLLLLFDPRLPGGDTGRRGGTLVLLDGSLSMTLAAGADGTRWQAAVREARQRAGGRDVIVFGDGARPAAVGALPDSAPGDTRSLLLPALQAAAEAGIGDVVVISDGGIEDADAVARWAPRLGLEMELIAVGSDVPDAALVEINAPQWVEAGDTVGVRFAVAGSTRDSVAVVIRRDEQVIGRGVAPGAGVGRLATGSIALRLETPPAGTGWVRLEAALENGDGVPQNDSRTFYVQVGDDPAGIALVSFRPDWEPRFLAPLLQRSLGLPLRAFLRGATGQYVRLAGGLEAGVVVPEADVRRAVQRGQLVVLHGLGASAPAWAIEAARTSANVLIFPGDELAGVELPVRLGTVLPGDFFPSATVPASPVAALLADVEAAGVAPLSGLRTVDAPADAWAPLMVTRGRQGNAYPLALAGTTGARRWAIALGDGYWQWWFRGGAERDLYARLWSALGGWLVRERSIAALPPVRPAQLALPRGTSVPWITTGAAPDSVHVVIEGNGLALTDTVLRGGRDTLYSRAPAPGHYSYRARAFSGDTIREGSGVLTIEQYSPDLARPRVDPARLRAAGTPVRGGAATRSGTPLHATAWPYLLLVALLAAEWILRRRWGLR